MDFKKLFAVLIVALFLLSSISFAYAEDSSEDMGYDVVQTDDYSGSGVVESEGYKLNSFMKILYVYGDFIKGIVDLEDYSQVAKGATATPLNKEDNSSPMYEAPISVKKKGGATATPLERSLKPLHGGEKILKNKLSYEKDVYEENFKNTISNFKKVPYLQNHNFWNYVNFKYDSFKKNMGKAKAYLDSNDLDSASKCIKNAKTDYIDMTVHVVNYHKNLNSTLNKLDKIEKDYKKLCDLRGNNKQVIICSKLISISKKSIFNGRWDKAHKELDHAQWYVSYLLKRS